MNETLTKERKETDEIRREALRLGIEIQGRPDWRFVRSSLPGILVQELRI
jgi:hypothetical protein